MEEKPTTRSSSGNKLVRNTKKGWITTVIGLIILGSAFYRFNVTRDIDTMWFIGGLAAALLLFLLPHTRLETLFEKILKAIFGANDSGDNTPPPAVY